MPWYVELAALESIGRTPFHWVLKYVNSQFLVTYNTGNAINNSNRTTCNMNFLILSDSVNILKYVKNLKTYKMGLLIARTKNVKLYKHIYCQYKARGQATSFSNISYGPFLQHTYKSVNRHWRTCFYLAQSIMIRIFFFFLKLEN